MDSEPGGLNPKKVRPLWYVAGAAAAGFIVYRYIKASQASAAAASTVQVDPSTGLPIDPSTGLPVSSGGTVGDIFQNPSPSSGNTTDTTTTGIATNDQWTQAAVTYLEGLGYDGGTVLTALSAVLAGSSVTQNQADIWHEAVAAIGAPPVGTYTVKIGTSAPTTGLRTLPYTVTGKGDTTPATLAMTVYGLTPSDVINISYDDVLLTQANPGIVVAGSLATGTTVTIPVIKLDMSVPGRRPTPYNQG